MPGRSAAPRSAKMAARQQLQQQAHRTHRSTNLGAGHLHNRECLSSSIGADLRCLAYVEPELDARASVLAALPAKTIVFREPGGHTSCSRAAHFQAQLGPPPEYVFAAAGPFLLDKVVQFACIQSLAEMFAECFHV